MASPFDVVFPSIEDDEAGSDSDGEMKECNTFKFDFGLDKLLALDGQKISEPGPAYPVSLFPRREDDFAFHPNADASSSDEEADENLAFKFDSSSLVGGADAVVDGSVLASAFERKKKGNLAPKFEELESKAEEFVWSKIADANNQHMAMKNQPAVFVQEEEFGQQCFILNNRFLQDNGPTSEPVRFLGRHGSFIGYVSTPDMAGFILDTERKTLLIEQNLLRARFDENGAPFLNGKARFSREENLSLWELYFVFCRCPESAPVGIGPVLAEVQRRCKNEVLLPHQMILLAWEAAAVAPRTVQVLVFFFLGLFFSFDSRDCWNIR